MRWLVAFVLILTTLAITESASALQVVDFRSSSATSEFPDGIIFRLDAVADASPEDVRLIYQVAPDGARTTAVPECTGGGAIACNFRLEARRQNALIPGADVTYFWRVTLGSGVVLESEPQLVTYEDDRFAWQTVDDEQITVWYAGGEDDARAVLDASREALDRFEALLQAAVEFPVKVYLYPSAAEMAPATLSENVEGVVTLGEVVYSDTAMVAADVAPLDTARHEVAHIVVRQAVPRPYSVPDWLNEGTAGFAQDELFDDEVNALEAAIDDDEVFSVRTITSSSAGAAADKVSLFYAQSWSLVAYLIEEYGEGPFAELFRAYADGATTGEALQQVYGIDEAALENGWRESVGLPPREFAEPDGSRSEDATPAIDAAPLDLDEDEGVSVGLIASIVGLTVALAAGVGFLGVVIARRYR